MENTVVGIGEILWDVFPHGKVLGGAPANFACHISQCGLEGYVVSAVGNDPSGKEILENIRNRQLNGLIETTSFPTGTVQVSVDPNGIPHYEICENVAWDHIPFTPEMGALARKTRAVYFDSLAQRSSVSRDTIINFLDAVPQDAYKILDINLRQHFYTRELIEYSLTRCTVLKLNEEEIILVRILLGWQEQSELQICNRLMLDYRINMIVLTKGAIGSYVISATETSYLQTPVVAVADTVGAGDSFTAALVASILRGKSIPEAHRFAVEVSAFVCTRHGATPELPPSLFVHF